MKLRFFFISIFLLTHIMVFGQRIDNFRLQDAVTGNYFELQKHVDAKGVVLIFTNNSCPFSKLYEDRIIQLHQKYSNDGFVFALVNPHAGVEAEETAESMRQRAVEKGYAFPYLMDDKQMLTKRLQVTKLPESVVITSSPTGFAVAYRGAIDNNPQMAEHANIKYLEDALTSIQNQNNPSPVSSRAVGCNIKLIN